MSNIFHKNFVGDDNHVIHVRTYADIAARDADTAFHVSANLFRVVLVQSPANLYALASTTPTWLAVSNGGGMVSGPISSTDNAVSRFDGTGGVNIQDSLLVVDDSGNVSTPGTITSDGELVARRGVDEFEIFTAADFPAAVSGVITLPGGTYIIKEDVSISDRLEITTNDDVVFEMTHHRLTYTGTATMLTKTGSGDLDIRFINFFASGTGAQVFDTTGGNIFLRDGAVFTGASATLGSMTTHGTVDIQAVNFSGFTNGFTFDGIITLKVRDITIQGNFTGTAAMFRVLNRITNFAEFIDIIANTGSNEHIYFIDPIITSAVRIEATKHGGVVVGNFFEDGSTGVIASFGDNNTGATAATAADDGGGLAEFTSIGHGLFVGETVDFSGFTSAFYTGSQIVTVATANTFKTGVPYDIDDSGFFATTTVQVNDVAHGLSEGAHINIDDTVNYDAGYTIFNVLTDSFEISTGAAFVVTETGTWDSGSLRGTSIYLTLRDNTPHADSNQISDIVVSGNAVATVINTLDVYEDLNLNAAAEESSIMEEFRLTNTTTGEVRFNGLNPRSFTVGGIIAAVSVGGAQRFDFQLLVNGSPLATPDNADIPIELGSALTSSPLDWPVRLVTDDLIRMRVRNRDGTSNLTIDTLKFAIR